MNENKLHWKQWTGKNTFYCNGYFLLTHRHCMTGSKDYFISSLIPHIALVSTNVFFIIFETPFYWTRFSPAIGIVQAVLFLSSWVCLFISQCSDPGVLISNLC